MEKIINGGYWDLSMDFNPNHDPENGQFAEGPGGSKPISVKEMFSMVDTYNNIAEIVGSPKMKISFRYNHYEATADNYKDFAKQLKEELIDEAVNAVLKDNKFSFEKDYHLQYKGRFDDDLEMDVSFNLYAV